MKKIKRKTKGNRFPYPAFILGYVGDDPPPGFLGAWYNQEYGGPLEIRFPKKQSDLIIETSHVDWKAEVTLKANSQEALQWKERLGWDHPKMALVYPVYKLGTSRIDFILFVARLARGLTLLSEGTAYDLDSGNYWNPSDWIDRPLTFFRLEDHVQVQEEELLEDGRQWLMTRGLCKFGMEEFEVYLPRGLSSHPARERLLELANVCLLQGKSPNVNESIYPSSLEIIARVVRHRTVLVGMRQLNVREVSWD